MKKTLKMIIAVLSIVLILSAIAVPAFAAEVTDGEEVAVTTTAEETTETAEDSTKTKIIAAAALIGLVAGLGAVAMAWAITNAGSSIARQPEAAGNIRTNVMLGLVFIETAIIYALIVAILIIFVL